MQISYPGHPRFDNLSRNTRCDRISRNILGHDRASANDGIVADLGAFEDNHALPDPDVIADFDIARVIQSLTGSINNPVTVASADVNGTGEHAIVANVDGAILLESTQEDVEGGSALSDADGVGGSE